MMKHDSPFYESSIQPYSSSTQSKGFCTQCGAQLVGKFKFCPNCGAVVVAFSRQPNQCVCNAVFAPEDKFCRSCGRSRKEVAI